MYWTPTVRTLLKMEMLNMCKFRNVIINRQILNSANIHLQSFGGHFTKYSSHQIFWLYYFLLILYRLAKYQHTRALQEIQWCYMCAAVPPVQFLLITISCYMLEKEILGVLMCIMSRASAHVPSCMWLCTVDWASATYMYMYLDMNNQQKTEL